MQSINIDSFSKIDLDEIEMPVFVVYADPSDLPYKFVIRLWELDKPTPYFIGGKFLNPLIKDLPKGLVRIERMPEDDPTIKEMWV
jgi:hypothetical protein